MTVASLARRGLEAGRPHHRVRHCPERDLSVCQLRTKNDLSRCDGEGWWRMKQHGSGRWEAWFAEAAAQDNNWPPITPACSEPASGRAGGATSDAREAGEPNSISRVPFVSSEVRGSRRWAQHHQIWPRRSQKWLRHPLVRLTGGWRLAVPFISLFLRDQELQRRQVRP